ncbi:hypothetical protein HDV01_005186 [Terramyces sp. JEL0728]|nr:hypothetical protein HDV01_005186 [Terramyces sp. JEL0728]
MSEEYKKKFAALCTEFYESCQDNPTQETSLHHFFTLFDSCKSKDSKVHLDFERQDLHLPLPATSQYQQIIEYYLSVGFDSKGEMIYPQEFVTYLKIKNDTRARVHDEGQLRRLAELELVLQSDLTCNLSPIEALDDFLSNYNSVGSQSFISGLQLFLYTQSKTSRQVEWEIEDLQLVETGIPQFYTKVVELLRILKCRHSRLQQRTSWICDFDYISLVNYELKVYSSATRSLVRPCGTLITTARERGINEKDDWGSLFWTCSYSIKSFFVHLF